MKKLSIVSAAAFLAVAATASAQLGAGLTLEIVVSGNDVTNQSDPANGPNGSLIAQFDSMAVDGNDDVFIFDSVGSLDGVLRWDSSTDTVNRVFGDSESSFGFSGSDMTAFGNFVYVNTFGNSRGNLYRVPSTATTLAEAVSVLNSVPGNNIREVAVSPSNNRLIISIDDRFSGNDDEIEDIVWVPLDGTNSDTTTIATEAQIRAALDTIDGDPITSPEVSIHDMDVLPNTDIVISHGLDADSNITGSILRVTQAGVVSVIKTADQIITDAGANPANVDIGEVKITIHPNGQIIFLVGQTSDEAVLDSFIGAMDADGTNQVTIATETQLEGALAGNTEVSFPAGDLFTFDDGGSGLEAKASIDTDSTGAIYFWRQLDGGLLGNFVAKLSGYSTTSVSSWEMY